MEYEITFVPNANKNVQEIERIELGLFSFDYALGSKTGRFGLPCRTMVEISGKSHVGKSTTAYYMCGKLASLPTGQGRIEICDVEGLDPQYLKSAIGVSGFRGKIHLIDNIEKGKPRMHSAMAQEGIEQVFKDADSRVMLLDSVGAFVPDAESQGDFGEAFMGRRAFTLAQFARKAVTVLSSKEVPSNVIYINHAHSVLAGQGHTTAGGETLKFLAAVRLNLWQKEVVKNSDDEILGFRVGGAVEKLRYGGKGKKFELVVIPDYGVSREMTAVYDASELGLIERGATVKVDGKPFGYISKLFETAISGNTAKFDPIFEKLEREKEKYVLGNSKLYEE